MKNMKKTIAVLVFLSMLSAVALAATTGYRSPTACSGTWTSCTNAFANDANRATASPGKTGVWNNYGFSLGGGDIITKVTVRADFFASKTNGFIDVKVSGDGGATYGPVHTVGGNTAEQTFLIDVTNDTSWTPSKLSNTNLRVNVACRKIGSGGNPTCNLDWVPVEVQYTPFDYSLSVNPNSGTVPQGGSTTATVTVTHLQGNPQTVYLYGWCGTCGNGTTTFSFNPSSGTPTYNSTMTITTNSTAVGTHNVTIYSSPLSRTTTYTLTVT